MSSAPARRPLLHGPTDPVYRRTFTLAAAALLGFAVYQVVQPFLQPFAWAAILALLMHPLQQRLTGLFRGRAGMVALVLTLLVLFLFIGPLSGLAIAFATQAKELAEILTGLVGRLRSQDVSQLIDSPTLQNVVGWVNQHVTISTAQAQEWALGGLRKMLQNLASLGGTAFFGAVGTVLSFTVMIFLLFFLLRDGATIAATAADLVPMNGDRKRVMISRLEAVTRAVVMGTILTAAVQGLLLGIGFAVAGLPAPVVFGVVGAVLSVVPFGGTALVWVPGALALFAMGEIGWGIALTAWGAVVVGSADNFLKPMFISGRAEVPTLAVFIGVLGGLSAFGLVGMFLGPILIALVLTLIRFASETQGTPASG